MQGKMHPLQSNKNKRTGKGMSCLGLRSRIIFRVLYIHPFQGVFSFDFLKCTSGVRPNANPFLRQRKPLPACLEPDLEHSPQPVRGSAHTSVSVHGERLRGRTDPARSCVLTAHAYVQHVCVSGHTGNHTCTRQKENIKLSSLKCIKVLKP